jgi:hypothetical protein
MKYTVIAGKFKTTIDNISPREAAQQALLLCKCKKLSLPKIVTVIKPDNTEVYLSTETLLN